MYQYVCGSAVKTIVKLWVVKDITKTYFQARLKRGEPYMKINWIFFFFFYDNIVKLQYNTRA